MVAFLLICLVPAALILFAIPVVAYGLMRESVRSRRPKPAPVRLTVAEPAPASLRSIYAAQWS